MTKETKEIEKNLAKSDRLELRRMSVVMFAHHQEICGFYNEKYEASTGNEVARLQNAIINTVTNKDFEPSNSVPILKIIINRLADSINSANDDEIASLITAVHEISAELATHILNMVPYQRFNDVVRKMVGGDFFQKVFTSNPETALRVFLRVYPVDRELASQMRAEGIWLGFALISHSPAYAANVCNILALKDKVSIHIPDANSGVLPLHVIATRNPDSAINCISSAVKAGAPEALCCSVTVNSQDRLIIEILFRRSRDSIEECSEIVMRLLSRNAIHVFEQFYRSGKLSKLKKLIGIDFAELFQEAVRQGLGHRIAIAVLTTCEIEYSDFERRLMLSATLPDRDKLVRKYIESFTEPGGNTTALTKRDAMRFIVELATQVDDSSATFMKLACTFVTEGDWELPFFAYLVRNEITTATLIVSCLIKQEQYAQVIALFELEDSARMSARTYLEEISECSTLQRGNVLNLQSNYNKAAAHLGKPKIDTEVRTVSSTGSLPDPLTPLFNERYGKPLNSFELRQLSEGSMSPARMTPKDEMRVVSKMNSDPEFLVAEAEEYSSEEDDAPAARASRSVIQ